MKPLERGVLIFLIFEFKLRLSPLNLLPQSPSQSVTKSLHKKCLEPLDENHLIRYI